jgi:hypothetical protein
LAECLKADGRLHEAVAFLEELQSAYEIGEISVPNRDLESHLLYFRALASQEGT